MSIYNEEKVSYFVEAMDSVLNQTLLPDEIILIRDGFVYKELQEIIDNYISKYPIIKYYPFEANCGLGNALRFGVEVAKNEYIFRMDTDDVSCPDRFEKQYKFLISHPEVDVLGGQIFEFISSTDEIVSKRQVPIEDADIKKFLKKRNAFNHMTVAFKKSKVLDCGNYLELHYVEDYYLWCRMMINGCYFHNLNDVLVYARIGNDMFKRRGGYKYFKSWKQLEKFKLNNKIISFWSYIITLSVRFIVQVIIPSSIRGMILKKYARERVR